MYLARKHVKGQGFKSGNFKQSDLPPPLEPSRLKSLVLELKLGNETVAEEIIGGHMGLIFQIVGRYVPRAPQKTDDILGVALMAIVEATKAFATRGVDDNITPYIVTTVHSKISDYLCHDNVVKITRYKLRQLAKEYELTEEENLPLIATTNDIDSRSAIGKQIIKAFTYLPADDLEVEEILSRICFTREESLVLKKLSEGMTESEVAADIGISRQRVNNAKKSLRGKILPHFNSREEILCKSCWIWME